MRKANRREKLAGDTRVNQYKWEFLRRNKEYQRDFAAFAKQFPEWIHFGRLSSPVTSAQRDHPEVWSFFRNHVGPAADKLSEKWCIGDPTDPFGDASAYFFSESDLRATGEKERENTQESSNWDYFSRVLGDVPLTRTGLRFIQTQIDIAQPLERIFADLQSTVELARARYKHHFGPISEPRKRQRARLEEYGSYLRVWDLRQEGMTFEEIATQVFPSEMQNLNVRAAMTKRVRTQFKRAQALIAGEYRRIEG